ncbi:branched-chain amino acid ABC transporter permease [Nocardioides sp.]|uniref:branched-chain amino acid ABC transporter permease n=1 Tax=Nocardioides sp. TaxID=35761 RepID=UPI00271D8193|nr:branched-chain amino acid ABC transporter permease [Nocardioides sp.]MDO9455317.1 branched-chain amino acid ABC transporter permease [Nocardioides sp.]
MIGALDSLVLVPMVNWDNLFSDIPGHTVDGLTRGAIYALVALGYTLVYGVMRLINFAHSEVFMVGTWAVLGIYTAIGAAEGDPLWFVIIATLLALIGAMLASAGTALVVERVAYKPLRKKNAPPLIFLITAIGCSLVLLEIFGQVLKVFFGEPFGRKPISIPSLVKTRQLIGPNGALIQTDVVTITNMQVIVFFGAVVMMFALDFFVNRSRLGRGVRAVAQDPETAALMGVNQDRIFMLVFILGGAMAGVAALLYTMQFDGTKFDVGFIIGVKAFTAAVLGGIGNLRGALLGGLLLGVVEVYASTLFDSSWADVTAFILLVLVLMVRPTGILGESLGKARA